MAASMEVRNALTVHLPVRCDFCGLDENATWGLGKFDLFFHRHEKGIVCDHCCPNLSEETLGKYVNDDYGRTAEATQHL